MKGTPTGRNPLQLAALLLAMTATPPALGETVYEVPLMRAASHQFQEGFVLVRSLGEAGDVEIHAWDDSGMYAPEPAILTLEAGHTAAFNSDDLEQGNETKKLQPGIGTGTGDWHLQLRGNIDFKVGAYMRTGDGFVTAMGSILPGYRPELIDEDAGGCAYEANFFNPAKNQEQQSALRLINYDLVAAAVDVFGIDSSGSRRGPVSLNIRSGEAVSLTSRQLENGDQRLTGSFGAGKDKWRLVIVSEHPLNVMNLLETPTGHMTNLGPALMPGYSDAAVPVEEIGCESSAPFIITRDQ